MRLVAKAVLWLHSTLYRLTNGRIGGRFIAGSPILLLTTIGRRTGKQRTRRWPTSATATASCCVPPTAAPLGILAGTATCARPAGPRSRSAPSTSPSAPGPLIPASAASCSLALCRCTRATPRTSKRPAARSRWCCSPRSPAEHDLTGCRLEREPQLPHRRGPQPPQVRLSSPTSGLASHR
jgi:F420H(2)-dependent quinone reductase